MLALSAGIRRGDDFGGLRIDEELLDNRELLLAVLGDFVLPGRGDHRELVLLPRPSPRGVDGLGLGNAHQMAEGPRDGVAVSSEVAVLPAAAAQDTGDIAGYGGFFGDDDFHELMSSPRFRGRGRIFVLVFARFASVSQPISSRTMTLGCNGAPRRVETVRGTCPGP